MTQDGGRTGAPVDARRVGRVAGRAAQRTMRKRQTENTILADGMGNVQKANLPETRYVGTGRAGVIS